MRTHSRRNPRSDQAPTIREVAELTARLRTLTAPPANHAALDERAAFLADKAALLARIPTDQDGAR